MLRYLPTLALSKSGSGSTAAALPFGSGRYSPLSARFTQAPLLYKFTVTQFVVFCKAFASFFAKPLDIKPGFHAMLETAERQKCGCEPEPPLRFQQVTREVVGRPALWPPCPFAVNENLAGYLCRGRRPRRPAEGSRPLPTERTVKGVQPQTRGPGMPGPYIPVFSRNKEVPYYG